MNAAKGQLFVAAVQHLRKESRVSDVKHTCSVHSGLVRSNETRHGSDMIEIRHMSRVIALAVATILVAASTVIPTLAYAQKYADHLSQYGGYDARAATISGLASLYVNPHAPMLPLVLSTSHDSDTLAVLPTSCSMDKTVLTQLTSTCMPEQPLVSMSGSETYPTGLDPAILRGPPRPSSARPSFT